MGPELHAEIAIMIGILIGAWVVKVAAVAIYMIWSRRRLDILEQQQQQDRTFNSCKPMPEHVIQALPVMTYAQLLLQQTLAASAATAHITDTAGSPQTPNADDHSSIGQHQHQQIITPLPAAACTACLSNSTPAEPETQPQQVAAHPAVAQQAPHLLLARLSPALSGLRHARSHTSNRVDSSPAPVHTSNLNPTLNSNGDLARQPSTVSSERDCCPICFNDYAASNQVKQLPCRHYYHAECIDEWLVRDNTCPLCKRPVWSPPSSKQQSASVQAAAQTGPAEGTAHTPGLSIPLQPFAAPPAVLVGLAAEPNPSAASADAGSGLSSTAGTAAGLHSAWPLQQQQQQSAGQPHSLQQQSLEVVVV